MLLNDKQRLEFAAFCRQNAETSRIMAENMEKVPGVGDQLAQRERAKAAAYTIVALDLTNVGDTGSISASDVGSVEDINDGN